ncbi:MAG TPA: GNAT family N-acetyltransferase [Magnetospirillum sp.]|jgi:ribosomal protein S18 acetylase RimI-like enzyme|nr:GNAT family N-acetyltransferase [Magnetospirillum sp.]
MIRPLAAPHVPALAEMLAGMDPWHRLGFTAAGLAAYLGREDAALTRVGIEQDGAPAAVLCLRRPWLRGPYIELLAVLPAAQGLGLGRQLVEWAAAQGGGNLWACVSSFNASARAFYGRAGFVEVAPLPGLVAEGMEEILLRRRL